MPFNLFNKKPKQLYADLKPADRIERLMLEFILPELEPHGFVYLKSQKAFKKNGKHFDLLINWSGNKYNQTSKKVAFDMGLLVQSESYRKWEKSFYHLKDMTTHTVAGSSVHYIPNWENSFYDDVWYDLALHDNEKLLSAVKDNLRTAGLDYFNHFNSYNSAITMLRAHPIKNLEIIVDFYILQDQWQEAYTFFNANNQWHEAEDLAEGHDPESQYSLNRKFPYELRKQKLLEWKKT